MITAKEARSIKNQNLSKIFLNKMSIANKVMEKIEEKIIKESKAGKSFLCIYDNWIDYVLMEEVHACDEKASGILPILLDMFNDNGFDTNYEYSERNDVLESGWYLKICW